jgi:septal ring factor EnvC (AmiA/AmiB activator)
MNSQIRLTTLKINETQTKITQLGKEIDSLSAKIGRLDESLDYLSKILLEKIVQTYKRGYIPDFYLLFSSSGFADFLSRAKYLGIVQAHDKTLMYQMQETKNNYAQQRELREEKKKEQEQLKLRLESQKLTLAQQIKDKQTLLEVTRNDERRYQDLLASARAEQQALEGAMAQALALLKNGSPVEEGAQIALMGNSGAPYCSTGTHLHFEIRKNDVPQNPANFLKNTDVAYDSGPVGRMTFTGDWNWPVNSPKITQEYGMSYWARLGWYNSGPHTGIDMTSSSSVIKAPRKGTLYKGATSCRGVGMNYVAIDHGDGLISWYWHVQ